jgi:lipopolysaccharide export system protein LptA
MRRRLTLPACLVSLLLLSAAAAAAQGLLGKRDGDQPIEINADSLEVLERERVAIFRGNVDALQGRIRLKADELKVHYKGGAEGGGSLTGAITRIDAAGGVFLSSPTETAQGDRGIYLVERREITLSGKVVLTKGENVIRGQSLVMNMDTGYSKIEGGGAAPGERVRGLFVPQGGQAAPAASGAAPPAPAATPKPAQKPARGSGN